MESPHSLSRNQSPPDWLREEFVRRVQRNPYYSQRAFARLIGVSSGRLSDILAGKRHVGPRLATKVATRLAYPPDRQRIWLQIVHHSRVDRSRSRKVLKLVESDIAPTDYLELSRDTFEVVADWYHLAILNLLNTADFREDPRWIARRLGITVVEARKAWLRLKRLQWIQPDGKRWVRVARNLTTTDNIPSAAIRSAHKQTLGLAIRALEDVPVENRDMSYITMAISCSNIPKAKTMIRNFRRAMSGLLENGRRTEVYNLNIALFPLTMTRPRTRRKR